MSEHNTMGTKGHVLSLISVCLFWSVCWSQPPEPCPHGWKFHGESCYIFITHVHDTWTEAEFFCKMLKANLVEIETAGENTFLRNEIISIGSKFNDSVGYWMGGTDAVLEGEWMWMTSEQPFTFKDWGPNNPDNYKDNEDCAHFWTGNAYHWNDMPCDAKSSFICEKEMEIGTTVIG